MSTKLVLSNIEQKVIFFGELQGQISDGNWENATPHGHYEYWMLAWDEVEVNPDLSKCGRKFWCPKSAYMLSKVLRECPEIAARLSFLVRLARLFPKDILPVIERDHWLLPESLVEFERWETSTDKYFIDRVFNLHKLGIDRDMFVKAAVDTTYSNKQLFADCKTLYNTMYTYVC